MLDLIYCAGNNRKLMQAALDAGWLLGVRSDCSSKGLPIAFVDNEYRNPDWPKHLRRVAKEQPKYATVPDLSETVCDLADIERAIKQADILANYCQIPLLVPKVSAQLAHLPAQYAIAYSVPSTYGGAKFGPWLLAGRQVHLLGGSPSTQRRIYRYIKDSSDVVSADGNMAQKVGLSKLNFWSERGVWEQAPRGTPCFDVVVRSFVNIQMMWQREE